MSWTPAKIIAAHQKVSASRILAATLAATIATILLSTPRSAEASEVSFAEARAAAERAAPDVKLAQLRGAISNAEVEVAGALANPTLSVSTARQTARLGLGVSVPLAVFGQRGTAVKAARADADAAFLDVEVVRREVRWNATVAWLDLWEAQERARLLAIGAEDADRLFQIARTKFNAGTGPRLDVVRTNADRARSAAEAEAAQRLMAGAGARLGPWIGAAPDAELVASGVPGYPSDGLPHIENLELRLVDHPAMRRDRAQVTGAVLHVESEQRQRWPTVTPQIALNQFDPTLPGPDLILGLAFDVPVLDLRGGAIARAQAQRALAEMASAADERRLRADLLDAYRRAEAAAANLRALREQVLPSTKEARDMTEDGYRSGRVDLVRLLEAERAFLDSRLADSDAAASLGRALADVEKAVGTNLQEEGHGP
jgi:cobalt-zinc-cadmium efflux system outer membrane protein